MQSIKCLLGNFVESSQTQKRIGKLKEVIVDPDTGKVVAFLLETNLPKPWLSVLDILEFQENKVLIQSEGRLMLLDDLPRIKQIKKLKIKVLDAKVFTEKGQYLGKATDLIFDEHTGEILRYYIARPFILSPLKAYLILDRDSILHIEKRGIIVKEPEKKAPAEALT